MLNIVYSYLIFVFIFYFSIIFGEIVAIRLPKSKFANFWRKNIVGGESNSDKSLNLVKGNEKSFTHIRIHSLYA